jgi:hypothetical protein
MNSERKWVNKTFVIRVTINFDPVDQLLYSSLVTPYYQSRYVTFKPDTVSTTIMLSESLSMKNPSNLICNRIRDLPVFKCSVSTLISIFGQHLVFFTLF